MLTMKAENRSGIVLAGGFSRRMGTDKAELTLGGLTLLELQIRKLRQIGIADIMISGYGKPMEGTRAIEDIYPHKGPMSGIHACLKAAKSEACLVVSVDVPLFPAEWLEKLVQAHDGPVTMLSHGDELEPLLAVYATSLASMAEELILSGVLQFKRKSGPPVYSSLFTFEPANRLRTDRFPERISSSARSASAVSYTARSGSISSPWQSMVTGPSCA